MINRRDANLLIPSILVEWKHLSHSLSPPPPQPPGHSFTTSSAVFSDSTSPQHSGTGNPERDGVIYG